MKSIALLPVVVGFLSACSSSTDPAGESGPGPVTVEPQKTDLTLQVLANSGSERIVMGSFQVGVTSGQTCTSEVVAGCTVRHCNPTTSTAGTTLDAGKITVTSASIGDHVELPITSGYGRIVQPGDFAADEDVLVSGAGGADVPAFELHAVVPPMLTGKRLGSCTPDAKDCALADGSPVAEWSGGSGVVTVSLNQTVDVPDRVALLCSFDAAAGKGKIPAEAMAKLPKDTAYLLGFAAQGTKVTSGRMGIAPSRLARGGGGTIKLAF